ncbi:MAG: hypothetical protein ACHQPH_07700 [Reyranellales bacterium]
MPGSSKLATGSTAGAVALDQRRRILLRLLDGVLVEVALHQVEAGLEGVAELLPALRFHHFVHAVIADGEATGRLDDGLAVLTNEGHTGIYSVSRLTMLRTIALSLGLALCTAGPTVAQTTTCDGADAGGSIIITCRTSPQLVTPGSTRFVVPDPSTSLYKEWRESMVKSLGEETVQRIEAERERERIFGKMAEVPTFKLLNEMRGCAVTHVQKFSDLMVQEEATVGKLVDYCWDTTGVPLFKKMVEKEKPSPAGEIYWAGLIQDSAKAAAKFVFRDSKGKE